MSDPTPLADLQHILLLAAPSLRRVELTIVLDFKQQRAGLGTPTLDGVAEICLQEEVLRIGKVMGEKRMYARLSYLI